MQSSVRVAVLAGIGALALGLVGAAPAIANGPPSDNPPFAPLTPISSNSADAATIADIDGDGDNDFVTVNATTDVFQVFIQAPAGTFTAGTAFSLPALCAPLDVAVADLEPGGNLEIAVPCTSGGTGLLTVFDTTGASVGTVPLGNQREVVATEFGGVAAVAVAQDGAVLFVTTDGGTGVEGTSVAVPAPTGFQAWSTAIVAITYQGRPSVTLTADVGPNAGFDSTATSFVPVNGGAIATVFGPNAGIVGDFNADGRDDLANERPVGGVWFVYYQQAAGGFTAGADWGTGPSDALHLAQFEGQCYPDVYGWVGQADDYFAYANPGSFEGFAVTGDSVTAPVGSTALAVGDLNEDGRPDIIADTVGDGAGLKLIFQEPGVPLITSQPVSVSVGTLGQPVQFTFEADVTVDDIQWQRAAAGTENWVDIPGATNQTLVVAPTSADNGARYRALVSEIEVESAVFSSLSCPATLSITLPATGPSSSPVLPSIALAAFAVGAALVAGAALRRRRLA